MKNSLLTILSLLTLSSFCQSEKNKAESNLNIDFEIIENNKPIDWYSFGSKDYLLSIDSVNAKSGKYSAAIEYHQDRQDFKAWSFNLPYNYNGKKITLSGYIKTENVTNGYAGLWMRIDPKIAFDNMNKRGVKATTEWTKYEITLEMDPNKTDQIVIGGLLVGKGKAWFDDFKITIDGKDIKDVKPLDREIFPAEKDKEFDNGSNIATINLENNQIENLKILGLVWGFLKYYHPNIAKGNYNWDYELFRILPEYLSSTDSKNRDEILVKWITNIGQFTINKYAKPSLSEMKFGPDLEWITTSSFSEKLTNLLLNVKDATRTNKHYYVDLHPGVLNPKFKNENSYSSNTYPDAGFRLLAVYRYWNMIQYYFPYKNLIDEDWKIVLEDFIPKVINANDETEYTIVMLELIGRVHDTHANIWGSNQAINNYLGMRYAPLDLTFIENKPVVTGYYDKKLGEETGLKIGDVISHVNNKPIDEIVKQKLKYTPASNYPTQLRNISSQLLRTNDTIIKIEFVRDDKTQTLDLKTFDKNEIKITSKYESTDTCFKLINANIAYINNGTVKKDYLPKIWNEVETTKGLIIDIRNYPSDFVIYTLSNYLMPKRTPFVKFTNGSIETPGLFVYGKRLDSGMKKKNYYKGKVVLLINELTQSSAEFHAMAYQVHPNATIIGSTTAGADGNVSQIFLPGGIITMISGIGVYYPDGKETQRIGIVPDIELKPTIQGIKDGRDELLEKAIEIIEAQ